MLNVTTDYGNGEIKVVKTPPRFLYKMYSIPTTKKRTRRFVKRETHLTRMSSDPRAPTTVVNLSGVSLS